MKIALTSVSDIQNYGDVLFPFIARQELRKYLPNANFRFFTPTKCKIEGEQFYAYSKSAMCDYSPDAILTIGGEVIHKYDDLVWQEMYHNKVQKPSNVIFDWLKIDNVFKAWFSVGALDLDDMNSCASEEELAKLDFIGVRGILSKKKLEQKQSLFYNKKIQLVPDIGWIFPRYLKKTSISLKTISNKYDIQVETEKYIVVNINWTSIAKEKILEILEILSKFSKETGLKVIFIQVISSYKKVNFDFNSYFKEHTFGIYLDTLSLHETGLLLMNCRFFIGSSLHCAITSLASLKPAGLIHCAPLTKFQDLYGHMMMTDLLSQNWNDFSLILNKLYKFDQERKNVLKNYVCFMQSCFDYKFKELIKMMRQHEKIRTAKCKKKILSRAWRAIYKTPLKKIRNSLSAISNLILSLPIHRHENANLLIVDNFEPSFLLTGFRVKEFNWLLTHIKNCKLLTFSSLIMNMSDWKQRMKSKEIDWSVPMSRSAF